MNILVSSAGRQRFLVDCFKETLKHLGQVVVIDHNKNASSFEHADRSYIAPAYSNESYINWLVNLCRKNDIKLIISLNIDEVILLNTFSKNFSNIGCIVCGADATIAKKSNDKLQVSVWTKELNLPHIQTHIFNQTYKKSIFNEFPIIAKPRYGRGSRGNIIVDNFRDLEKFKALPKADEYIVQEYIIGQEYGFDIINDFDGKFKRLLARRKIIQSDGESQKIETVDATFWLKEAKMWSEKLAHKGTANFDVIFSENKGYVIDINLRFSGDYVFSHIAGANTPQILINSLMDIKTSEHLYIPKPNIVLKRTDYSALRI